MRNPGTTATPRVSIVIPTRDCLAYLPTALDSVKTQGVPDIEVIVIDDGSIDGTAEWLKAQSAEAMPYLIALASGGNGPGMARNRGIAAARAPLIAFLDADDVWLPGKLAPQLAYHFANPEIVFSFTDYAAIGSSHGTCFEYWSDFRRIARSARGAGEYQKLERPYARIFAENVVGTSTVVARRDALQNASGFDASLHYAEDWDLWLRLARIGQVGFTTTLGAGYLMRRPGSASENIRLRIECMRQIVAAHAPIVAGAGEAAAVRRASANLLITEADWARIDQRYHTAVAANLSAFFRIPSLRLGRVLLSDALRAAKLWRK